MDFAGVIKLLLGGAIGAFFSWLITSTNGRNSETSKQIDRVQDLVIEIQNDASKYWALPYDGQEPELASHVISGKLKRLGTELNLLSEEYWVFSDYPMDSLIAFRQCVSGGAFGSKGREAEENRIPDIQEAANNLISAIHRSKRNVLWPRW